MTNETKSNESDKRENKVLDITNDTVKNEDEFTIIRYNIPEEREKKRGEIALRLISIVFYIIVVFTLLSVASFLKNGNLEQSKEIINSMFTPMVTLVGTAIGFYFGKKK